MKLAQAVLCLNCEAVFPIGTPCPDCASDASWVSIQGWLNQRGGDHQRAPHGAPIAAAGEVWLLSKAVSVELRVIGVAGERVLTQAEADWLRQYIDETMQLLVGPPSDYVRRGRDGTDGTDGTGGGP